MRSNDYFEWNGRLRDIWRLQVRVAGLADDIPGFTSDDAAQLMCHLDAAEVVVKRLLVPMLEEGGGDRHGC